MHLVLKSLPIAILVTALAGCVSPNGGYVAKAGLPKRDEDACKPFERPAIPTRSDIFASRRKADCVNR